jgi:hypothetical protein
MEEEVGGEEEEDDAAVEEEIVAEIRAAAGRVMLLPAGNLTAMRGPAAWEGKCAV